MGRLVRSFGLLFSLMVVFGLVTPASAASNTQRQLLTNRTASYPRLIRLEHSGPVWNGRILASVTSQDSRGKFASIFASTDEGANFYKTSQIRDPEGADGMCCGTLYELPQPVGALPAGTILFAATYGIDAGATRRVGIKIWSSSDGGHSWSFLSEAARSHNHDGVFEPKFNIDTSGTLWMHFADET